MRRRGRLLTDRGDALCWAVIVAGLALFVLTRLHP